MYNKRSSMLNKQFQKTSSFMKTILILFFLITVREDLILLLRNDRTSLNNFVFQSFFLMKINHKNKRLFSQNYLRSSAHQR